jgi:hypothetical protein
VVEAGRANAALFRAMFTTPGVEPPGETVSHVAPELIAVEYVTTLVTSVDSAETVAASGRDAVPDARVKETLPADSARFTDRARILS